MARVGIAEYPIPYTESDDTNDLQWQQMMKLKVLDRKAATDEKAWKHRIKLIQDGDKERLKNEAHQAIQTMPTTACLIYCLTPISMLDLLPLPEWRMSTRASTSNRLYAKTSG